MSPPASLIVAIIVEETGAAGYFLSFSDTKFQDNPLILFLPTNCVNRDFSETSFCVSSQEIKSALLAISSAVQSSLPIPLAASL